MTSATTLLLASAVSVGFLHTLPGTDHYVPFVAGLTVFLCGAAVELMGL